MEVSTSPAAPPSDATSRRRSGRAVHKPVLYQQDPNVAIVPNGSAKRKRGELAAHDDTEHATDESSSDHAESEPDEEELKEKRRRVAKPSKTSEPRGKAAAKKSRPPKDDALKLAMRPATNGVKKVTKPRKPAARKHLPRDSGSDLYGTVGITD